jgi:hypothetical protein
VALLAIGLLLVTAEPWKVLWGLALRGRQGLGELDGALGEALRGVCGGRGWQNNRDACGAHDYQRSVNIIWHPAILKIKPKSKQPSLKY